MRRLLLLLFLWVFLEVQCVRKDVTDRDFVTNINVSPYLDDDILINNSDPEKHTITINKRPFSFKKRRRFFKRGIYNDEELKDDGDEFDSRMGKIRPTRKRIQQTIVNPVRQPQLGSWVSQSMVKSYNVSAYSWTKQDRAVSIVSSFSSQSFGLYTLIVGYHLKQNLLNILGYIMYQPIININRRFYMDFSNLKISLQLDDVDVFKLIPFLGTLVNRSITEQFQLILDFLVENLKNCQSNCLNTRWREQNVDLDSLFSHWSYNPIFNGIIDVKKGRLQEDLEQLIVKFQKRPLVPNVGYASKIFSPVIVDILHSIQQGKECLSESLMGYLLAFYPFPLNDNELDMAINQITMKFIDGIDDAPHCKLFFHNYNHLALKPIELLKAITDRILDSFCPISMKSPAKVIRKALDDKVTVPNYRNILRNKFVSVTDLGKLLNQIDLRSYPVEIVMAKERVKEFAGKILPYIDYQEFPAYKFDVKEETLMAFLSFIQIKTPHAPISVKASINAIKAYYQFSKGSKTLTPELLISLTDAWLAPDLNDEIIDDAYALKLFILDEGSEIRRVLSRQQRKCSDVMQCFIKATSVLRNDEVFSRRSFNLKIPHCIMYRYLNFPSGTSKVGKVNLASLLEVINPQGYRREIILAANRLKSFLSDGKDLVPGFNNEKYCTKQEVLVAYLEQAIKNTNFPREMYDSMRALIPSVAFKIRQVRQVNVRVAEEISKAFAAPDNDEAALHQMVQVANFMAANEVVVDLILDKLNPVKCNDVLRCYNQMADILNKQNFTTFTFPKFRPYSPELYVLNIGFDTSSMSVEKILRIVQALCESGGQENNELDAAILYSSLTAHLVDPYLNTVTCNDKQVLPCFESLLYLLKQQQHNLDVKVSVYQYLLSPTTCDRRYCQWITYYEHGSTVLNPVLEYMKFLTEAFLRKMENFHLRLEMESFLDYLRTSNVNFALNGIKLKLLNSDLERFIAFLNVISKTLSVDDPITTNVKNIVNFFTMNVTPKEFCLGNLRRLIKKLEKSTPSWIYCEMNDKLAGLISEEDQVSKLLKPMQVDCSTLMSCLSTIDAYITEFIYQPYAGIILQIIRPDGCFEENCEWTRGRFKIEPNNYVKLREKLLETLFNIKRAPDTEVPLIVKLLIDVLLRNDRLSHILLHLHPNDVQLLLNQSQQSEVLYLFLEVILKKYNPPPDISPSLNSLYLYFKRNTLPTNLNHETLINLLVLLSTETRDDIIRTQINIFQDLIVQKMAIVNAELTKLEIVCVSIDQCMRSLYERTQTMSNVKLQRFLHQILLAPGCPIAHCPRKISVSKQAADNFVKFILERFDVLKDHSGCTYHLALDVDYVKNLILAHGAQIVTSHLLYKKKEPTVVFFVLNAILNQERIPTEVALSVSNILNFFNSHLAPTYIHMYHLNNMGNILQSQALDENVKKKFITILENLETRSPELNQLLIQMPVNCTTFKSCLISLYLRLLKENRTGLVQYLMEFFAPIGCNDVICPWLVEFPSKHVEQVKHEIINQINAFNFAQISFQLHSDFNVLKSLIDEEILDDIYGILGVQGNVNLIPFLEALGTNVMIKYEAQGCVKNIMDYLTKGVFPNRLGLNGLRSLEEMFYNLTTDTLIRNDIREAMNDLDTYHINVKTFLNKLIVNCADLSSCIQSIYDNLQVYKNDPMSVIVKNLLFPNACTKITCPWILEESIEISLEKLRNIKNAITQLVDSDTLPIIISIDLDNLKGTLHLEKIKDLLPRVDLRQKEFLVDFLKEMYRSSGISEEERADLTNLIAYFTKGTIPDKLTIKIYRGLVKTIKRLSDDILVIFELAQLEKKAERYPKVIENILSNCPVACVKLPACIHSLKDCLLTIKSPYAKIMLEEICPLRSQDARCTGVDYGKQSLLFPGKLFYPNQLIFFINIDNTLRHVALDLTNQETIIKLSELPPIETFNSQIALLEFRDTVGINRRITIDFNNRMSLEKILRMNPKSKPTIDFNSMGSTIVYIPTETGKLVPIKLDHSLPTVREGLKQLVRHQLHNGVNPELTIIDFDGTKYVLAIDVNNNALWKSLLKISSDNVHIDSPFLMMFPGKYGNSWRSVLITDYDRHAINTLQHLPTFEEINTIEPVLGVTGGMIQLCFNVFDSWVVSTLRSMSKMSMVPIIQTKETKSLLLGVPDRMGNLVPLRVDLNDSRYVEALAKTSQQLACTTGCQPTFILQTDSESIPLHLNFDNPLALLILIEELRSVERLEISSHSRIIVIQDNITKEFIILIPDNYLVAEWLEDLSRIPDTSGDRITIALGDGSSEIHLTINRNNPLVMQYLKQLMQKTLVSIFPTVVVGDDGKRYLAMTVVQQPTGNLVPVVIELNPHNILLLQGISQPYDTAAFEITIDRSVAIKLTPNDQNILGILPMVKQGDMMGVATETQSGGINGDVVAIPIVSASGKYTILFFETRKAHVYNSLKETCDDTTGEGRSVVLTRPSDGQTEVIYCSLTPENEDRLKRHAGRVREKLPLESTVIMTIPDKTGMPHAFILDLSNLEVVRQLRHFTSMANSASENKVAIDYTGSEGYTEIFIIDLNKVTIEEIRAISYLTPSNMLPIQKDVNGNKLVIVTYPEEQEGSVGHLILNITEPRTQEILTTISEPGNPMATKISIETAFGKIEVFVDFDDTKHIAAFRDLSKLVPLLPAPLLIKRPQGLLKYNIVDQYGRLQTIVLNVSDQNVLETIGVNPNKPKLSIIDSEGKLNVITVDVDDQQWSKIGTSIYKPDKNTIVVIGVENEQPIILDVTQPEIKEILKMLNTGNPNDISIILQEIDDRKIPIYINIQDERSLIILREAQMRNSPNLYPTLVPTYDSKHSYIVFTIQVDDVKTMPVIIDNSDVETITRLIEVSDKSNPASKLITITDFNGMTYPLYLDLNDVTVQHILTEASSKIRLTNWILTNTDEKIEKYLEVPIGKDQFTRCDLTNPSIMSNLLDITNRNRKDSLGLTVSIVNPDTKESAVLALDVSTLEAVSIITELCEKQIFVQPNPSSTLVVYVNNEGFLQPIILNLENELTQQLLDNLNEVLPTKEGNLIQFVDSKSNLRVYRIDFENAQTQQLIREYNNHHPSLISPTIVTTPTGHQALVMTIIDEKKSITPLYITLDSAKVFNIFKGISNPQDINATPIMITDNNDVRHIFYINLDDAKTISILQQLSWESSSDKTIIPVLPTTPADNETTVAVLDNRGRVVIFTLDFTNPWVLQTVSDLAVTNTDKPTVSVAIPSRNGTRIIKLDITNEKIVSVLETVSSKQEFKSNPGDLIILPDTKRKHPIILDIANEDVVQTLQEISHSTLTSESTHMFVISDKEQNSHLIKLNLEDTKVQTILEKLNRKIPFNLKPTQIVGPEGQVFSAFTILDVEKQVHSFVLDVTNEAVQKVLQTLVVPHPMKPFEVTFLDKNEKLQTIILDSANEMFIQILERAQEISVIPRVAMKNIVTDATIDNKLLVPIVQENGNVLQYTFDLTSQDVVLKLMQVSSVDVTIPAITIYVQDQRGVTHPIRLDVTNTTVLEHLQLIAEDVSAAYTFRTALIFVVTENGQKDVIILDKDDKRMVEALIHSTSHNFVTTTNCTILNVIDEDGNTIEIKLNLHDSNTTALLKNLQVTYTPKVIKPFVVKLPNGQLPLVVFSFKRDGLPTTVALDLNNPEVLEGLRKLHMQTVKGKYFVIPIPGPAPEELYINIEDVEIVKQLIHLCQFTNVQETPLLLPSNDFVFTILDSDGNLVKIHLDTRDQLVLQELIEISKQAPHQSNYCAALITDFYESTIPIRIDMTNDHVVNQLMNLAGRFIYPKRFKVIPKTGYVPLQVFDIPIGTFSFPITIDCNNGSVLNMINQQMQNLNPGSIPIKIMACEQKGISPILIDMEDKNLPIFLTGLSVLSPVILNPTVIITKPGHQPLLNMLLEVDYGQASVTLDLNDQSVVDALLPLQPQVKVDVTTFFYDRQGVKYPLYLNLKDSETLKVLKELTLKSPVRLIPIIYKQPIWMITLDGNQIKLDLSNPKVTSELERIGAIQLKRNSQTNLAYIEIPSKYNLPRPVYLDLYNVETVETLKSLQVYTPPSIALVLPNRRHKVILPRAIIHGPVTEFPIATFFIVDFGPVCIDLNVEEVRHLSMPFTSGADPQNPTFVMIPHISGDVYILRLDLLDANTLTVLKNITSFCRVFYEPTEDLNVHVVAVTLPKKVAHVDMNRTDVLEGLKEISVPIKTGEIYGIYLEVSVGVYTIFNLDINDVKTQEVLYKLERPQLPPFLFELRYQDLDMSVWKIVIDVNSYEIMDRLVEFSETTTAAGTTDVTQIITLKLMSPQGRQFDLKLDKTNPLTLQILKEMTFKSTTVQSELLIKPKPKNLQYIEVVDQSGVTHQIAIDVNNLSVLRKLQQIVDSQENGPKTSISFKMPDGSTRQILLDVTDTATIENLLKLSIESERGIPAQLIRIKAPKRVIPILMSFPVTAPFLGSFSVTVDVGKTDIVERLRALAAEFIPGRSEVELSLRDSFGKEIILKLDLTNSTTLYKLVMLTIDSTGHNPTGIDPIEILHHYIYVPDIVTVEIPDGYEILPISFDRSFPETVRVLKGLPMDTSGRISSWELIENNTPLSISIDSTTVRVQTALRSVSIQTLLPRNPPERTGLFGLFFLAVSGEIRPIFLELSRREIVISLVKLARSSPGDTFFEVRDDFSQYVTIGLDFNNPAVTQTLVSLNSGSSPLYVDARKIPYLIVCLPASKCIKIKLKPSSLDQMAKLPEINGSCPVQILNAFDNKQEIFINPNDDSLLSVLSKVDSAATILPPLTTNVMIIYVSESDEVSPIYVDLTIPKIVEMLNEMDAAYNNRESLAIITYLKEDTRQYLTVSLNDHLISILSKDNALVRGHSIVKQKPWQKTTINVPSSNGTIIPIVLDMADKEVVVSLKEMSRNIVESPSVTVINLEDAYGFPFQVKLNIYDENIIGQLIMLSNKQNIV